MRDKVDILAGFVLTPECARGRRRFGGGKKIHGGDERGDGDHHHQVALHGAHLGDGAADQRDVRHLGRTRAASGKSTRWSRITARATTPRARSSAPSRKPAARWWARCGFRSPIRTSPPSCSAPRTSIRKRILYLGAGRRAAGGHRQGLRRARHGSEKTKILGTGEVTAEKRCQAWATPASASSRPGISTTTHSELNQDFIKAFNDEHKRNPELLIDRRL